MGTTPKKTVLVGINGRYTHSCLALFYVRNELERHYPDLETELFQFIINDDPFRLILRIVQANPDYLFFSSYIWNSSLIQRLVRDLRKLLPDVPVVIGGPQAKILRMGLGSEICTVVEGPIEGVVPEFWTDLATGKLQDQYGQQNIRDGLVFSCPYREDDFTVHLKNRALYYESSRGCPFQCSYCLSAAEKGVIHLELDQVFNELSAILKHRPKIIRFVDRTFNDLPDRALAIWRFLLEQEGDTRFHFEMAPDRFNEEMLDFLASVPVGLFQFEVGIQSTNPKTLAAIHRRVDIEASRLFMQRLSGFANIHLHLDLILGLPYEDFESFGRSFNDIFGMGGDFVQMGLLKILPDTPMCGQVEEFKIVCCTEPPYQVLGNRWLDHHTLSRLYWLSECVEKFRNNRYFPTLWSYLAGLGENMFQIFLELLEVCQQESFFERAPTQELMNIMLIKYLSLRSDAALLMDILRYDWLRCGFRFLPDYLSFEPGRELPVESRSRLYGIMPQEIPGIYDRSQRNHFFRKSFFLRVGPELLQVLGIEGEVQAGSCLCFLAEKDGSSHGFQHVILLPGQEKTRKIV